MIFAAEQWLGLDHVLCADAGADMLTGASQLWTFEQKFKELLVVSMSALTIQLCAILANG